jgi:hypothetical protein
VTLAVATAVRRIIGVGAPVLCLDTCALLDVMRDPMRENFSADQAGAALFLLSKAQASPRELSIVIAEQVYTELTQHMDSVEAESWSAVRKIERALGIFARHGLVPDTSSVLSTVLRFPSQSRGIVERFGNAAHIVKARQALYRRAFHRISMNVRPARRGKDSAKDCLIVETYLETARVLRANDFQHDIVFLTTNPTDYEEKGRPKILHPELLADFAAVNLAYQATFMAARYSLFPHRKQTN